AGDDHLVEGGGFPVRGRRLLGEGPGGGECGGDGDQQRIPLHVRTAPCVMNPVYVSAEVGVKGEYVCGRGSGDRGGQVALAAVGRGGEDHLRQAVRQLALGHHRRVGAALQQVLHFGVGVRPGDDGERGVGLAQAGDDLAGLQRVGDREQGGVG